MGEPTSFPWGYKQSSCDSGLCAHKLCSIWSNEPPETGTLRMLTHGVLLLSPACLKDCFLPLSLSLHDFTFVAPALWDGTQAGN